MRRSEIVLSGPTTISLFSSLGSIRARRSLRAPPDRHVTGETREKWPRLTWFGRGAGYSTRPTDVKWFNYGNGHSYGPIKRLTSHKVGVDSRISTLIRLPEVQSVTYIDYPLLYWPNMI